MGLLSKLNETKLKSLRFGKDRIDGGSSNQPYITKPIPSGTSSLTNLDNDFILRGGILAATNTADDVSRLTKMFFDTKSPNGLLFTVKQNLLSRIGVKTQAGGQEVYLPTSTLAQAGVNAFGLHFYKQGVNPIPLPFDAPIVSLGALGNLSSTGNIIKYSQVVPVGSDTGFFNLTVNNRLYNFYVDSIFNQNLSNNTLYQYNGGPGSILGIGPTKIKFADQRTITLSKSLIFDNVNYIVLNTQQIDALSTSINGSGDRQRGTKSYSPKIVDFRNQIKNIVNNNSTIISNAPDYNSANIENRVNLGDPGAKYFAGRKKNLISYAKGSGLGPLDKINAKQLYSSRLVDINETNDLVKFRIEAIDNDDPGLSVFIHFRAFLDAFNDNYSATWNPTKYVGRGENFYTYENFTREISINWTVAAQSKEELIPMYQKLNYLASNLMPDYSANGYLRGPMMRLTVGGYLYSQPGFITSLNYTVDDNSTWEIGISDSAGGSPSNLSSAGAISDTSVKELPHMIKVTMNFTPIHEFVPRKQTNTYHGASTLVGTNEYSHEVSQFGPERYIALASGKGEKYNNYDTNNYTKLDSAETIASKQPNPLPVNTTPTMPQPVTNPRITPMGGLGPLDTLPIRTDQG
jgi:hypothetical protein